VEGGEARRLKGGGGDRGRRGWGGRGGGRGNSRVRGGAFVVMIPESDEEAWEEENFRGGK